MVNKGEKGEKEEGTVPSPIKEFKKKETELNYFGLHKFKYFMRTGHNISGKMFFVHY